MSAPAGEMTYAGVLVLVFASQMCLPVPASVALTTAGALAAKGHLHLSVIILAGVVGCLGGDGVWFLLGRRYGQKTIEIMCRLSDNPGACSERARERFDLWGLPLLLVAKFLPGLSAVTPPMAGAQGASFVRFFSFDAVGSLLWVGTLSFLGAAFSDEIDAILKFAGKVEYTILAVIGAPLSIYVLYRILTRLRKATKLG